MSSHQIIHTSNAPAAIGPYSQAVRVGETVYLSGQIPLDPVSGQVVGSTIEAQAHRVFENLRAVCEEAGSSLSDIVRIGLYLTTMDNFGPVNAVMAEYFTAPFPARSTIAVAGLPRGVAVEVDAVMVLR